MRRRLRSLTTWSVALASWAAVWIAAPGAQACRAAAKSPGKANWLTDGGDNERTAWQKNETLISKESVKNMKLLWKLQLDNQPRQMHNLFPPLIVSDVTTAQGPKEIAVVAGVSDNVYGIDVATGDAALVAQVRQHVRRAAGRPRRRRAVSRRIDGDAGHRADRHARASTSSTRSRGTAGCARSTSATGTDVAPPEPFLPPNGKPYALNLWKNVIYTTTAQGCGGNPNAFYGYDLATKKVGQYLPGSGGMWPRSGPSIGKDGTVYAGSGDGDYYPGTPDLRPVDHRREAEPADQGARVEGLVYADQRVLAAQARSRHERHRADLRLQGQGVPGAVEQGVPAVAARHRARSAARITARRSIARRSSATRTSTSPRPAPGARSRRGRKRTARAGFSCRSGGRSTRSSPRRSSTASRDGARWPRSRWKTRPARWCSRRPGCRATWIRPSRRSSPTASSSRTAAARTPRRPTSTRASDSTRAANRIAQSTHATLYALDAHTGKELWSSGDQITSFNHFSGLSVANGRVYIGTYDGMLYCFGVDGGGAIDERPVSGPAVVDRGAADDARSREIHWRGRRRLGVRRGAGPRARRAAANGRRATATRSARRGCGPTSG